MSGYGGGSPQLRADDGQAMQRHRLEVREPENMALWKRSGPTQPVTSGLTAQLLRGYIDAPGEEEEAFSWGGCCTLTCIWLPISHRRGPGHCRSYRGERGLPSGPPPSGDTGPAPGREGESTTPSLA